LASPTPGAAQADCLVGAAQAAQATEAFDQFAPEVDRAFADQAGTQKDRHQFGIGEDPRALLQQLFTRTRVFRPVADRHAHPSPVECHHYSWKARSESGLCR
jgi:hypothetical protein